MTAERLQRVLADATALPLKERLQVLDALRSGATLERDGLRFALASSAEFKRARKRLAADQILERWLTGFGERDVFYDIGANTGAVAMRAAILHAGRVPVYAFEPASDSYDALVRNVLANALGDCVTTLHVALLDATGVRPLHRSALGAGTALHAVGEPLDYRRQPFEPASVEPVLAFRLDDLLDLFQLPAPTRIKLDVDGFEHKVVAGASRTLSAGRCEVYVEIVETEADDPHPLMVIRSLERLGYRVAETVHHRPPGTYPQISDVLFVAP